MYKTQTICDGCKLDYTVITNSRAGSEVMKWFELWQGDFEWHTCSMDCLKKIVDDGLPVVDTV